MPLPNFIVIGAGRSGTTSLHHYLGQHPEIYVSPLKELRYFAFDGVEPDPGPTPFYPIRTMEEYLAQFAGVTGEKAIGESSPAYLWSPVAAERIHQAIPQVRILAILRNPTERLYSTYLARVRYGRESRPLRECWNADRGAALSRSRVDYFSLGCYHTNLKRYARRFDRSQMQIHLYEDLCEDPHALLRRVFRFLEVDQEFSPDIRVRHNPSGVPRHRLTERLTDTSRVSRAIRAALPATLWKRVHRWGMGIKRDNLARPALSPTLHAEIVDAYRDEVLGLQEWLGRDLSSWLEVPSSTEDPLDRT